MKRSKMLELIADVISYKNNKLREVGDDTTADEVLEEIEKAGMLPPYRPSDEKVIRCQISEWEPE